MASTGVGGSLAGNTVTVDTTGAGGEQIAAGRATRKSLILQNLSASVDVYLGQGAALATSNGIKLAAGATLTFDEFNGPISGVVASGSADVRYLEVY